jgi:exopolyphosphatase/guanosine-5'-triphosphate,3'-diphosphate pyrophosphatase
VGEAAVKVGVVDIGTNSMRLLITDGVTEVGRWVEVTGLGRGVDSTGYLSPEAVGRTLETLRRYGELMYAHGVEAREAIATSACRDAANREEFFDQAEEALGVRPTRVSGAEEARLAYEGATYGWDLEPPGVVCDIGGGSTELVTTDAEVSVEIGSVRLTERALPHRPAPPEELVAARRLAGEMLAGVSLPPPGTVVGVAGTWTSLAAMDLDLPAYDRERVHGHRISCEHLGDLVERLASLTVAETESIPSLDPARAPVILGGAVVAEAVTGALAAAEVIISECDTLDGVARRILALA